MHRKRLARTVLIFTERSDQLSMATDRVPGLPASPGYAPATPEHTVRRSDYRATLGRTQPIDIE